jgi:anti-sigma regulatory factor (Ser/Thr protein kinase)
MTTTRPNAIGAPGYSESLPCEEESASVARGLVRTALHAWSLEKLVKDGELIVSELVTNSIQHSGCRCIRVVVDRTGERQVRIAVSDRSRKAPSPRMAGDDDEAGRGLLIIAAYADRWGTEHRSWGKIVWAELEAKRGA